MRESLSEWECMPGNAPGLIESMDAAGYAASVPAQGEEDAVTVGGIGSYVCGPIADASRLANGDAVLR